MASTYSVVGNTLFPGSRMAYQPGTEDNYYLPGRGEALESGDPSETYGLTDPRVWAHFKNQAGSNMGYSYQRKRDCDGKKITGSFNPRLARMQDRITRNDSGARSMRRYIEVATALAEFFPDQQLAKAMKLFEKVKSRLTGNPENDYSCVLACIEFWLLDSGTMIKTGLIDEINGKLDLQITRSHLDKHKMPIKKACVELYGREETFKRFHYRGPAVIKKHVAEVLVRLAVSEEDKQAIKHVVQMVVERQVKTARYAPKHYESHALALVKIAGEELGLWNGDWNSYLLLDEVLKRSVYMVAWKYRKSMGDLTFALPVAGKVEVMTAVEATAVNASEVTAEVMTATEMVEGRINTEKKAVRTAGAHDYREELPAAAAGDSYQGGQDNGELSRMKQLVLNLVMCQMRALTGQGIASGSDQPLAGNGRARGREAMSSDGIEREDRDCNGCQGKLIGGKEHKNCKLGNCQRLLGVTGQPWQLLSAGG